MTIEKVDDDLSLFMEPLHPIDYMVAFAVDLLDLSSQYVHKKIYYGDYRNGTLFRIGSSKHIAWDEIANPNGFRIIDRETDSFRVKTTTTIVKQCDSCGKH